MIAERVAAGLLREFGEAPAVWCDVDWAGPVEMALRDESAVQAACGIMHVHGRASGIPRRLGVDYASAVAGVLAVHGMLAAALARARGARIEAVRTSVAQAALLAVGQHLAVATTDDEWDERWSSGPRPPFRSQDGIRFELETLHPEGWQRFWAHLGAEPADVAAGWWPFQQRFATASCALPEALLGLPRRFPFRDLLKAAARAEVGVLPVRDDPGQPTTVPACTFRDLPGSSSSRPRAGGEPLDGIVVVESTRRIQGPMAGHVLRMLGAEIIRVEPPGGDPMRGIPPISGDRSARFRVLNDGKRITEADLKTAAGREELRELVAAADAFVHNWAPGRAERRGLDADDLARVRPGLVYAWSSGWAPLPWPDPPLGTDFLVQAHSGLAATEPDRAPSLLTLTDIMGGLVCAAGVLAALLRRERTGLGARVDSSLYSGAGVIPRTPAGPARLLERDGRWVLPDGTPVCTDLRELAADPRFKRALNHTTHVSPQPPWEFA
ncbi:CoA transferase [Saccharopolyspora karakumensis]|uniref:CoA transferase n=1 Tax=Saccharopolyspora karakumensis TaxID=2530386 RepID=A0A4R5BYR5_9PSEU|nr:CoA transferase [Saccharopolyspora karakumensis]TDD90873.1 CoA transferase [Saccharopolyspora karakumensis]